MPYVYSTATAGVDFIEHHKAQKDLNVTKKKVTIHGGSNCPNRQLVTPHGVVTEVSAEDAEFLKKHDTFKEMSAKGFFKIVENKAPEPNAVVADMVSRDESAPLVPGDYTGKDGDKEPTTTSPRKNLIQNLAGMVTGKE